MVIHSILKYMNYLMMNMEFERRDNVDQFIENYITCQETNSIFSRQLRSERNLNSVCHTNSNEIISKPSNINSMYFSVLVGMSFSSFFPYQSYSNWRVPFVVDRMIEDHNCHILIKETQYMLLSNQRYFKSQKYEPLQFYSEERLENISTCPGIVKIFIPKPLRPNVKVAVIEEIFTKELLDCFALETTKTVIILNVYIHQIPCRPEAYHTVLVYFRLCVKFEENKVSFIRCWYNNELKEILKYREVNFKRKTENKHSSLKFVRFETCNVLSSKAVSIKSYGLPSKKSSKQSKFQILESTKTCSLTSTKSSILFQMKEKVFQYQSNKVKYLNALFTQYREDQLSKIDHFKDLIFGDKKNDNTIPEINISVFNENPADEISIKSQLTSKDRKSSLLYLDYEYESPIPNEKICNSRPPVLIKTYSGKLKFLPSQNKWLYSLPENVYLKYKNDTLNIQLLISNPISGTFGFLQKSTITNSVSLKKGTKDLDSYNDWLLSSFPLGLTYLNKENFTDFKYAFSLYIRENEISHKLVMDFFNIKLKRMTKFQFQQWCIEKCQYNTMELYEILVNLPFTDSLVTDTRYDQHVLKFIANRCNCLVTISDRFVYGNDGRYRAVQFVGKAKKSVLTCIRYLLRKT